MRPFPRGPRSATVVFVALVVTIIVYLIGHHGPKPALPAGAAGFYTIDGLRYKIFYSGPIPVLILWTFTFGFIYLGMLWRSIYVHVWGLTESGDLLRPGGADIAWEDSGSLDASEMDPSTFFGARYQRLRRKWRECLDSSQLSAYSEKLRSDDEDRFATAFVPVKWAEWMLPMLGFLGTVVGMILAIGMLQVGVRMIVDQHAFTPEAYEYFEECFKGLALAFDTTFLGFVGLMLIGGPHLYMRKRIALRLSTHYARLNELAGEWAGVDRSAVLIAQVADLERRFEDMTNTARHVIEYDPEFGHIKKVLYKDIVEFAKIEAPCVEELPKIVAALLGGDHWSFGCLATAAQRDPIVALAVRSDTNPPKHYLCVATMAGSAGVLSIDYEPVILALTNNGNCLVTGDSSHNFGRAYDIEPDGSGMKIQLKREHHKALQSRPKLATVFGKRNDLVAVLYQDEGAAVKVGLTIAADQRPIIQLNELDPGRRWSFASAFAANGNWLIGGEEIGGQSAIIHLVRMPLAGPEQRLSGDFTDGVIAYRLPSAVRAKQVEMIYDDTMIIRDATGSLYYWQIGRASATPIDMPDELRGRNWMMIGGRNGRFAAVTDGTMTMWQVQRGGTLIRSQANFHVGAIPMDQIQATPDGRYVVGAVKNKLFVWSYPQNRFEQS